MNTEQEQRLTYLLEQLTNNEATKAEFDELFALIRVDENEAVVKAALLQSMYQDEYRVSENEKLRIVLEKILKKNSELIPNLLGTGAGDSGQPVVRRMFPWRRWAVAASIILALGIGTYFIFFNDSRLATPDSGLTIQDVKAPETNRAMITLANGEKVYLDEVGNGELAMQNNVRLIKTADGKIIYDASSEASPKGGGLEGAYNTLTNPKGSKVIDMTLADGSRVWLNAGSSVTYPVAFVTGERKVSITGEAYFEITHDASKPFKVSKGEMEVTVIGTRFNVNAYDDEADIKVTLLDGSVKVNNNAGSVIIKPGEQAILRQAQDDKVNVNSYVDVEQVMAWKRGMFEFSKTELPVIMRQIARWYNVEVVYNGQISDRKFGGGISRDLPLSEILGMLEANGGLKFQLEGKRVTVEIKN